MKKNENFIKQVESTSNGNNTCDYITQWDWFVPVTVHILLFLATSWILISLIQFGIKSGKWRRKRLCDPDKLNTGLVYSSVILLTILCLIRYVVSIASMTIGFQPGDDVVCDQFDDITSFFYSSVIFAVQLFLWFRQRALYANQMLNLSYNKAVKFFSCASIVVLFVTDLSALIFVIKSKNHFWSPNGCVYHPISGSRVGYLVSLVLAVVLGQTMLLGLFVYALKPKNIKFKNAFRQSKATHNTHPTASTTENNLQLPHKSPELSRLSSDCRHLGNNYHSSVFVSCKQMKKERRKHPVKTILRKTLFFAVVSILADIFIQILINYIAKENNHRRFVTMTISINALLNLLFVIFSFAYWWKMLISPCNK